jgi:hypothetical protein
VYVRRSDPSVLAFSLSLYRHPSIFILCRGGRFTSDNKQITLVYVRNLVSIMIYRCPSSPRNPVYVRRVDPSVLTFSLTLHRHPHHDKYSFYLCLYLLFIIKTLYSLVASSWADVKPSRRSMSHYVMWNNAFVH